MKYQEFLAVVAKEVQERLGGEYHVKIRQFPKNNGGTQSGITDDKKAGEMAPVIYLDQFYHHLGSGIELEDIISIVIDVLKEGVDMMQMDIKDLTDFTEIRERIAFKLINTEANQELLEDIPNLSWLDLSIVFYLILGSNAEGQMTSLIHNHHLSLWGKTGEELYRLAKENTPRLLPVKIRHILDALKEAGEITEEDWKEEKDLEQDREMPMYVLTNGVGLNGACCMLPEMGIEILAEQLNCDLVVLPSSVHEVLSVPYDSHEDLRALMEIVEGINRSDVSSEERLSDRIYYYSREDGMHLVNLDGTIAGVNE